MKKRKNITTSLAILVLCILFFIIGILCANVINKEKTDNNYKEYSKFENITIYTNDDYNQKNLDLYIDNLNTISKKLTKNCKNIYFSNENLNEKFDLNISTKIVAISYGSDIYVTTDYYSDDVLTHEMFHVYDYCNNWISSTNKFEKLYESYKDSISVSPGNQENIYEFFASYGEKFILNNDDLEKNDLYNFFSDLNIQY